MVVHQLSESDAQTVTTSLMRAEVTSIVGHGAGPNLDGKFTAVVVALNGSEIGPGGVRATTTDSHGTVTPVGPPTEAPMDRQSL